jgi:hypothetical protein
MRWFLQSWLDIQRPAAEEVLAALDARLRHAHSLDQLTVRS